jgi:UDP-glucose 4-epimerase
MIPSCAGSRVLVTGASGFIGRNLCRRLLAEGASVVACGRASGARIPVGCKVSIADLLNRDAVRRMLRSSGADSIVHLAALKSRARDVAGMRAEYAMNLGVAIDLAEEIIDLGGCRRFVLLGSAEEYGSVPVPFDAGGPTLPQSGYGLSKLAAMQFFHALALTQAFPLTAFRTTVVYGPEQPTGMFIPSLIRALLAGERFPMTLGQQTRDFVYVDDVVDGLVRGVAAAGRHAEVLHLSSGVAIPVRDVARQAARIIGEGATSLLDIGAISARPGEAMTYWAENTRTRDALGWSPTVTLEEGLRRTIAAASAPAEHG